MPRFYFDVSDSGYIKDYVGLELADAYAARQEANSLASLVPTNGKIIVRDESGTVVCEVFGGGAA